jgi:hypothetical protein
MANTILRLVKVFIGSPGGLEEERQAAKRIVDEINQSHAEHWGCQIQLVGWEATLPGYSRAQSLINQDLDKCEYFVGVLWNNWGSKPDDGDSRYTSGFEEEYERAKERVEQGLMKDIALYFKDINEVRLKNLHPTYQKVITFRKDCLQRRKPLFKEFKELVDFEPMLRAKISEIGWREASLRADPTTSASSSQQPTTPDADKSSESNGNGLIEASAARFITGLLQKPSDWEHTDSFEVARLRLIATGVSRQGNDALYLGNHDANLLFLKRSQFQFSNREISTLLKTGVAGFYLQNVPLWHWLTKSPDLSGGINTIEFFASFGRSNERLGAIRILQSLGRGTPSIDDIADQKAIIKSWLSDDEGDDVTSAALSFLRTNGTKEDLNILVSTIDDLPAKRRNDVTVTAIALAIKEDISEGFRRLVDFNPDPVRSDVIDLLFAKPESIPTSTLEQCLLVKSDVVRKRAAKLLSVRRAIDVTTAERLMTDNDLEVRSVAVEALEQHGKAPDEATIKKALTVPEPGGGLFGLGIYSHSDDSQYMELRRRRLSNLNYEALQKAARNCGVYDYLEIAVLNARFTRRNIEEIRSNLADGFKGYFESKLDIFTSQYGAESKLVADTRGLEKFLRDRLTSLTLDVLCKISDDQDLWLIRKTLDEYDTSFSESALKFLARFGDWSDKDRIISFTKRHSDSPSGHSGALTYLLSNMGRNSELIATALYAIAKSRLIDLLNLDVAQDIRRYLIKAMSQRDIICLSDDIILRELNSENDQFRRAFALKCVEALSQSRARMLLHKYTDGSSKRYYNSIHWLDLGASMPRQLVKNVTKFQLQDRHD